MRRRTSRRIMWVTVLVLLLALVVPPFVNVNRYRRRAVAAIGRAFGREVTASNIGFKLLPRPAVVLSNFVAADDPSYGAEPMLRADSVTAYLRLTSLWRGRFEVGTLDLDNPSLNVVRRVDGHWNIEQLLERASQATQAPTATPRPEARPRFPYVEASSGRINFKLGEVKKGFAFTDADFALWLQSENEWRIRLQARPVRTDLGVSDTGTLKLAGRFQRAANLRDTPMTVTVDYADGPLGQVTKLFYGRDRGWRGDLTTDAVLAGTPASLAITLDAQVSDFHRYDISMSDSLRLRTHCTGTYAALGDDLHDVHCESPIGGGLVRVHGNAQRWGAEAYDVSISGEHIPADRIIAFARHAKKDLPSDLTAEGDVEAVFTVRKAPGGEPHWSGGGQSAGLALESDVLKQPLELGIVQFAVPEAPVPSAVTHKHHAPVAPPPPANAELQLVIKPLPVALGDVSPATISGELDQQHYGFHVSGDTETGRLLNVAQALGIETPGIGLAGSARVNLDLSGPWMGFARPTIAGRLQINTATAELQGLSEPLMVDSASVVLDNDIVNIASFSGAFRDGTRLSGSATFPAHCTAPENCVMSFDLRAPELSAARLNQLMNPASAQPWYHLLAIGRRRQDALSKLHAQGRFAVASFGLERVTATNVNGSLELSDGKLRIQQLRADLLGGHEDGSWLADFTVSPPRFIGNGIVTKLSMSQVGSLMHDSWATGNIDANYSVSMSGLSAAKLLNSATGTADFRWSGGALRHVMLDDARAPMAFSMFSGKVGLESGTFTLTDCKLQSGGNLFAVAGTASYDGSLDLKLDRAGRSYAISGTISKPRVQTVEANAARAAMR